MCSAKQVVTVESRSVNPSMFQISRFLLFFLSVGEFCSWLRRLCSFSCRWNGMKLRPASAKFPMSWMCTTFTYGTCHLSLSRSPSTFGWVIYLWSQICVFSGFVWSEVFCMCVRVCGLNETFEEHCLHYCLIPKRTATFFIGARAMLSNIHCIWQRVSFELKCVRHMNPRKSWKKLIGFAKNITLIIPPFRFVVVFFCVMLSFEQICCWFCWSSQILQRNHVLYAGC